MTSPLAGFTEGIYSEHLEEASFLYEQRLGLLTDPELTWLDLEDFEERLEAHIDGLFLGDELALAVCKQQAGEGDFGELYAALCVFCRHDRFDLATEIIDALDPADEERVGAVADAMLHELPESWIIPMQRKIQENPLYARLLPRAIGYQRRPASEGLAHTLFAAHPVDAMWALGRLRDPALGEHLKAIYEYEPALQREASLAMMRIGHHQALSVNQRLAVSQPWALLHVGLCGGPAQVNAIQQRVSADPPSYEGLLALGLLGDPVSAPLLLHHLAHPDVAEGAAFALYLMTGAALFEEVFVPEEIDEDMLFEEELEKLEKGEPLYPPGEEPGITYTRIARDPAVWQGWWKQHQGRFTAGVRFRHGRPCDPLATLEELASEHSPNPIRRLAYEELVIRYALDVPFEADMPVRQQKSALFEYKARIESEGGAFSPGKWYYAGRLMT